MYVCTYVCMKSSHVMIEDLRKCYSIHICTLLTLFFILFFTQIKVKNDLLSSGQAEALLLIDSYEKVQMDLYIAIDHVAVDVVVVVVDVIDVVDIVFAVVV